MKSNEVFEVTVDGRHIAYVEAPGKPQARMLALKHVAVTKLSGTQVAAIAREGKAILSETSYSEGQQALPPGDDDAPQAAEG